MGTEAIIISSIVLLTTVLPMVLVFRRVFGGMRRQAAETQRLLQVGIPAPAQILGVQMGGMTVTTGVHRHLQLMIQLQVQAPGRPPYMAQLTSMISELQIPQIQPGAIVQVRIDPANPMKLALEGVGNPAAAGMGYPGHAGAPAMNPGMAPAAGLPRQHYGAAPAAGVAPIQPMQVPAGAKIGMIVGLAGSLVAVAVTIFVVMSNVGAPSGIGSTPATSPSSVCGRAIACCGKVAAGAGTAGNCKNLGQSGMTEDVCQTSLDAFARSAEAQGMTCE